MLTNFIGSTYLIDFLQKLTYIELYMGSFISVKYIFLLRVYNQGLDKIIGRLVKFNESLYNMKLVLLQLSAKFQFV